MDYQTLNTCRSWNDYFLAELKKKGFEDDEKTWESETGTFKFVHFSPNLSSVIKNGAINVSGGGLMGAVYVTPLHSNGEVHNLGKYIHDVEFPQSLSRGEVECLVFEVSKDQYFHSQLKGKFNYIFESASYYSEHVEPYAENLLSEVLHRIGVLLDDGDDVFLREANMFFNDFSFLKHVYFESLNEYLYTRQNSKVALEYLKKGEVYARDIKNYLFEVSPKLKTHFSTTNFLTDSYVHEKVLKNEKFIIEDFDPGDFSAFLSSRIRFYLRQLLTHKESLLGRILLKTGEVKHRFEVEQNGLAKFQKEMQGVAVYQYDTIPKGEIGIAATDEVIAYRSNYDGGVVELKEQIDLTVDRTLISGEQSVLRIKS